MCKTHQNLNCYLKKIKNLLYFLQLCLLHSNVAHQYVIQQFWCQRDHTDYDAIVSHQNINMRPINSRHFMEQFMLIFLLHTVCCLAIKDPQLTGGSETFILKSLKKLSFGANSLISPLTLKTSSSALQEQTKDLYSCPAWFNLVTPH